MATIRNIVSICFIATLVYHISKVESVLTPNRKMEADEAPFVVYIRGDRYYCSGVILNERIVLTSAHCTDSKLVLVAGRSFIFDDANAQTVNVTKVLKHAEYSLNNEVQAFYDICLLLLESPLTFNPYVQPIQLSTTNHIDYEKTSTVYGWGAYHSVFRSPLLYLRGKNVSLIPDDLCIEMLSNAITKCTKQEYEFCAHKAACHGDSGGPIVQKVDNVTKLIGITAWGADDNLSCDTEPGVYENVGYFSQWINNGITDLMNENVTSTTRANFTNISINMFQYLKSLKNVDPTAGHSSSGR